MTTLAVVTALAAVVAGGWWLSAGRDDDVVLGDGPDDAQPDDADLASDTTVSTETAAPTTEAATDTDEPEVDGPRPRSVLAVQGPVEANASYVSVSWSHVDLGRHPDDGPLAMGYEIERDGAIIGAVDVDDEPWDDMAYRDLGVEPGIREYRVRARFADGTGPWSAPAEVTVLSDADIGPVFFVDDYDGTDRERAQEAVDAAAEAGGGIVVFGSGTYVFDDGLVVSGSNILLRGAGRDQTILRAGFAGAAESCDQVTPLVYFRGDPEEIGVMVASTVDRGATTIEFDAAPPVEVGEFLEVDGVPGQLPTYEYTERGIAQDPSIPQDERYPFEAGTVVAVDGNSVTIDHPISPRITEGSELYLYPTGRGNGIELLTVEGNGPDDTTYHRLIDVGYQVDFRAADISGRWANRNVFDASGHNITVVGLEATEPGAAAYQPEPCKYKVGFGPATNVTLLDSVIGSADDDRNMSLVTFQFTYRGIVRNAVLGRSRTYGVNEHGGGSRDLVVENSSIGSGPTGWSGILLGNDTWGFGGETAIRNNRFIDNPVDVEMVENPYGVVVVGNQSTGCSRACVTWSGWGGVHDGASAIKEPDGYGSARLTVTGNRFADAAGGLDLGGEESSGFPWTGIRDVVVTDNVVEVDDGPALRIRGDQTASGRIWVTGNRFGGAVETAEPGTDWWFDANTAGPSTGSNPLPDWSVLFQPWEGEPDP